MTPDSPSIEGRCACGAVAFTLLQPPLFVHACHCTRCQRETGAAFAHHLLVEASALRVTQGAPQFVRVPTDSGRRHWVAGCTACHTGLWNVHGSRSPVLAYLRAGVLDTPGLWPPQAHIYVRSMPAWMRLDPAVPAFDRAYDARRLWPADSLSRYELARKARSTRSAAA